MDDTRVNETLVRYDIGIDSFLSLLDNDTCRVKEAVRNSCVPIKEDVSLNINTCEVYLSRSTALIVYDAEYHILSAYHQASPGLIAILVGIYEFIATVISVVSTISNILEVITGENLLYWVDQLLPGFQSAWNDIMNKISDFSSILGWGVDGVHHLLNAVNTSADMWGMVTGKDRDAVKIEKYKRTERIMGNYSLALASWQSDPGKQIASWAEGSSTWKYNEGISTMRNITDKLGVFGEKADAALTGLGSISSELLGIQNNMPAFIANNIPQGLWDAVGYADLMINERILPALTGFTDRLDELDAVLDSYQKKAAELADKLAHPGDLLAEIDKLPAYARQNQLVKIDDVTSMLMKENNEAAFAAIEGDLTNFGIIAAALEASPAPLTFMELDLPGRSPGITPEPHETWILEGNY